MLLQATAIMAQSYLVYSNTASWHPQKLHVHDITRGHEYIRAREFTAAQ